MMYEASSFEIDNDNSYKVGQACNLQEVEEITLTCMGVGKGIEILTLHNQSNEQQDFED